MLGNNFKLLNNTLKTYILQPPTVIAIILFMVVGVMVYSQYGKGEPVQTSAASVNNLSWVFTEPEITVSSKIYRTTTDFLEDPDDQYLIATVPYPTSSYTDTAVSDGVTYYYSIFQIDDTSAAFDPFYDSLVPVATTTGSGGSSGGGGGSGGGGSPTPPSTITTGLVNASGTFYLLTGGYRKGVTSPGIMYSCGFEFKDARTATSADLSLPPTLLLPCGGALVRSQQDQTVYLISTGKRYAFTSASVFLGLGFKFSSVLLVTNPELQALPQGDNLSDSTAAHLPEVDINVNGTIYWLDSSLVKHPYPSLEIYNSWHRDGDFTTVVPANSNDLNLTTGSFVPMRF